jgi:hypothetical protein
MSNASVTLKPETFDALVGLAEKTGNSLEDLLDTACKEALSQTAQAGFEASFQEHRDFYEGLEA